MNVIVPDEVSSLLDNPSHPEVEIRTRLAAQFYATGKIGLGKAAEIAGMVHSFLCVGGIWKKGAASAGAGAGVRRVRFFDDGYARASKGHPVRLPSGVLAEIGKWDDVSEALLTSVSCNKYRVNPACSRIRSPVGVGGGVNP